MPLPTPFTTPQITYTGRVVRPESCVGLAGASPVWVGTGAPSSRSQFVVETRRAERDVESLFGGRKIAGRTATRWESCSLVTVTTGEPSRSFHGEGHVRWALVRGQSTGSLRGRAARDHSSTRNRRGPSGPPSSGKDPGYKPMVKSQGGQRESDGVVVPLIGVRNAPGGKGPDFDRGCIPDGRFDDVSTGSAPTGTVRWWRSGSRPGAGRGVARRDRRCCRPPASLRSRRRPGRSKQSPTNGVRTIATITANIPAMFTDRPPSRCGRGSRSGRP